MRFGVCTGLSEAAMVLEAGFDYVEIAAAGLEALDPGFDASAYVQLAPPVSNVFFPGSIRLFGPQRTPYEAYARALFVRAEKVGLETMVVGSGGSRRAPEGVDPLDCEEQFVAIVAQMQEWASPHGIRLAPESLARAETNVGNDLGRLARALAAQGCDYCADSYHILTTWREDFPGETLPTPEYMAQEIPHKPRHVHLGNIQRHGLEADDPMLKLFAGRLRELGYDGLVSLECGRDPGLEAHRRLRVAVEALFG